MPIRFDMTDRIAIVTGAASGIGRGIAARFAQDGAKVLAVDLATEGMPEGETLHHLAQDISAPDAAATIIGTCMDAFGGLDILINNAGICPTEALEGHSDDAWERTMAINVDACFKITRAAVPALKKSTAGRVVNVGSIMSDFGAAEFCAYSAAKHAVAGLTKSLANDLGPYGVTANYIQPGAIRSGITQPTFDAVEGFEQFWIEKSALKRIGEPEDVAPLVSFLVSEEAGFISGEGILIDGGAMSHP